MAIVTLSKKEAKRIIGNVSDEKLEHELSMFGLGVERITGDSIELEVTPNRPDLLSQQGMIRALKCFIEKKGSQGKQSNKGRLKYKLNKPEKGFEVKVDRSVKDVRPYTACAIVKNLELDNEKIKNIIDIQEALHSTLGRNRKKLAIGIYPLEKISLPIRYEARKPEDIRFIPLDAAEEMNALQVLQRHATGRAYAHLLKDAERFPVFADAKGEILSMPPIINSNDTGKITQETKDVFIECSGFDFSLLKKALNILVTMFADIGGRVYQMKLDYGFRKGEITPDLTPEKMKINPENVNKLLGIQLNDADIKKLLRRMGYEYSNKEALIPAFRADIMHEVDIIEDIAIAHGYDKFIPEIPQISTIGEEDRKEIIKRKIAEILVGLEMLEISSLHLLTAEDLKRMSVKERDCIELEESKTDYKFLRQNLLSQALKTLSENVDAEYPQKIFELGRIFRKDERAEAGISEKDNVAVAMSPANFTEAKQALEYLGRMLNKNFTLKEAENSNFISGRCGKILCGDKEIGILGEIHPSVLKKWRIKMPAAAFELCAEEI